MKNLVYLFGAFAVIWAGVGLYLFRLAALRGSLEKRIQRLEEQVFEGNNDGHE